MVLYHSQKILNALLYKLGHVSKEVRMYRCGALARIFGPGEQNGVSKHSSAKTRVFQFKSTASGIGRVSVLPVICKGSRLKPRELESAGINMR